MTRLHLMRDPEPDDILTPDELAEEQTEAAFRFIRQLKEGGGVRLPWPSLDQVLGPMLPGWLVVVGGRPSAGKTTFLLNWAIWCAMAGRPLVYVGTETEPLVLRIKCAAILAGLPVDAAVSGELSVEDEQRLGAEMKRLEKDFGKTLIFAGVPEATIDAVDFWAHYATVAGAGILFFDYFQRLETGGQDRWVGLGEAVRRLKNIAVREGLVIAAGAQLKLGDGLLAEHLPPANNSWYGTSGVQHESDVAIQLWRAMRAGVDAKLKQQVTNGEVDLADILRKDTMSIRVAKHRYRDQAQNQFVHLRIHQDRIEQLPSTVIQGGLL